MNYADILRVTRMAVELTKPMLPDEHTTLMLRNTQPTQDSAYDPTAGWPAQSAPVEYALSGFLGRNTVQDDEGGGVATSVEQQTFKAVFDDLDAELQTLLSAQQGKDDICRMDGPWKAVLANGGTRRIKEVTRAGTMVTFVMRKVG